MTFGKTMPTSIYPKIKRVPGVGEAVIFYQKITMRIWLKPDVMGAYGLIPSVSSRHY
jgi:HAE1 family hydrophobic/amphiphilic exporter-1